MHTNKNLDQNPRLEKAIRGRRIVTWVTSAEVTQMITTAAIRNKPALYLQPITNPRKTQKLNLTGELNLQIYTKPIKIYVFISDL